MYNILGGIQLWCNSNHIPALLFYFLLTFLSLSNKTKLKDNVMCLSHLSPISPL